MVLNKTDVFSGRGGCSYRSKGSFFPGQKIWRRTYWHSEVLWRWVVRRMRHPAVLLAVGDREDGDETASPAPASALASASASLRTASVTAMASAPAACLRWVGRCTLAEIASPTPASASSWASAPSPWSVSKPAPCWPSSPVPAIVLPGSGAQAFVDLHLHSTWFV